MPVHGVTNVITLDYKTCSSK